MNNKVLIVEDQFIEANDIQLMLTKAGYSVCGIARSVPIAREMIKKENPGLVLLDIFVKGKLTGIDLAKELRKDNIAFIFLSANSNEEILAEVKTTQPHGFIVKPFREKDLLVTLEIARYRYQHSREYIDRTKAELVDKLYPSIASTHTHWKEKYLNIGKTIQATIPFDLVTFGLHPPFDHPHCFLRIGFDEYQLIGLSELSMITGIAMGDLMAMPASDITAAFFNRQEFEKATQIPSIKKIVRDSFSLQSLLVFPVPLSGTAQSVMCLYSRRADAYQAEHLDILYHLQKSLTQIIGPIHRQEKNLEPILSNKESKRTTDRFSGIIGNSHLLLNVFDQITQVAPFDTSVLILGESGTGKERVAGCIHDLSPRKGKALVKVNCATLPATLIESELFGHEKGAFTGAVQKRTGKFEQANGGTIFLDEIGDMPVDLQVKLLRVIQEKEIEPIGSRSPIKIDVRIVAATNRNLEKEVAEGRFRLDLYYRLNVFPIDLPPLRARAEDIPILAHHFIQWYNRKAGKQITGLSEKVLHSMMTYHWPGNIRELENLIERSVLLTRGAVIEELGISAHPLHAFGPNAPVQRTKTMQENERDYILAVLQQCAGRVWGPGGAAEVLHLPPSTLKSKMKKLGIGNGQSWL